MPCGPAGPVGPIGPIGPGGPGGPGGPCGPCGPAILIAILYSSDLQVVRGPTTRTSASLESFSTQKYTMLEVVTCACGIAVVARQTTSAQPPPIESFACIRSVRS